MIFYALDLCEPQNKTLTTILALSPHACSVALIEMFHGLNSSWRRWRSPGTFVVVAVIFSFAEKLHSSHSIQIRLIIHCRIKVSLKSFWTCPTSSSRPQPHPRQGKDRRSCLSSRRDCRNSPFFSLFTSWSLFLSTFSPCLWTDLRSKNCSRTTGLSQIWPHRPNLSSISIKMTNIWTHCGQEVSQYSVLNFQVKRVEVFFVLLKLRRVGKTSEKETNHFLSNNSFCLNY